MKNRAEIEEKFKWDLTKFCKNDEEFYSRLEAVAKQVSNFKKYEGKLSDEKLLFECLEFQTQLCKELSLIAVYANLRLCEDNADRKANEMCEKQGMVVSKLSIATSFIDVEISKFKTQKLLDLQRNSKFKNYKRFFEGILKDKKHTLSKKEELLLSKMGEFLGGFSTNFDKFSDVDLKFDKIKDGRGEMYDFDQSKYSLYFHFLTLWAHSFFWAQVPPES